MSGASERIGRWDLFGHQCCWAPGHGSSAAVRARGEISCSQSSSSCTSVSSGRDDSSNSSVCSGHSGDNGCCIYSGHSSHSGDSSPSGDAALNLNSRTGQRGGANITHGLNAATLRCAGDRTSPSAPLASAHGDDPARSNRSDDAIAFDRGFAQEPLISDRSRLAAALAHQEEALAVAAAVASGGEGLPWRWRGPVSIFDLGSIGGGLSDGYRLLRRVSDRIDVDRMSYEELLELGERIGHVRRRAPTAQQLATLPRRRLTDADFRRASLGGSGTVDQVCSVCREVYQPNDELRTLPCLHVFHVECIDRWLTGDMPGARFCPVCNTEVPF